jgi:hypothetical protein
MIVLMLPPTPAMFAVMVGAPKTSARVYDLHTGFFDDPKWAWAARLSLSLMRRRGVALVTNTALQSRCERAGVRAVVLHDPILDRGGAVSPENYLLCPLSYANDEPLNEMLEAAALTPSVRWVLTGRAPTWVRDAAPSNVEFTGFVGDEEFDELMRRAAGVAALTTRPHTMQRAGYEALMASTAQVTSDFPELREFLADAAVYVDRSPASIAGGVMEIMERRSEIVEAAIRIRALRIQEQSVVLRELEAQLVPA